MPSDRRFSASAEPPLCKAALTPTDEQWAVLKPPVGSAWSDISPISTRVLRRDLADHGRIEDGGGNGGGPLAPTRLGWPS